MKMISLWLLVFTLTAGAGRAQSPATQQQIDVLTGKIQELVESQDRQSKRLDALAKDISELRDKVNTPPVNDSASREDLKNLAEQVQEIDKKRQADKELILKNLTELAKVSAEPTHHKSPTTTSKNDDDPAASAIPQKGYEYEIKPGDTLGLIIKACREQGVKVTLSQLIAANPKMNPNVLIPGKKIFIPDPKAK